MCEVRDRTPKRCLDVSPSDLQQGLAVVATCQSASRRSVAWFSAASVAASGPLQPEFIRVVWATPSLQRHWPVPELLSTDQCFPSYRVRDITTSFFARHLAHHVGITETLVSAVRYCGLLLRGPSDEEASVLRRGNAYSGHFSWPHRARAAWPGRA